MEHAEFHIDFHRTNSIETGVSDLLHPRDPEQVCNPVRIDRMPRKECRRHKPRVTNWFDDPWPEMYRDLEAAIALQ